MLAFFEVLDKLVKLGLIDPEKDTWDHPENWALTKFYNEYATTVRKRKANEAVDEVVYKSNKPSNIERFLKDSDGTLVLDKIGNPIIVRSETIFLEGLLLQARDKIC